MKICMLIWNFWPGPQGGTEHQCYLQSKELARRGLDCVILTRWPYFFKKRHEAIAGFGIRRLGVLSPLYTLLLRLAKRIRRRKCKLAPGHQASSSSPDPDLSRKSNFDLLDIFRYFEYLIFIIECTIYLTVYKNKFDILHVHGGYWMAGYSRFVGRLLNLPTIAKAGTLPVFRPIRANIPFASKWQKERLLNSFIAQHERAKLDMIYEGVPSESIHVVSNGVEIPEGQSTLDRNTVLMVGNLTQGFLKGFDVLFKAWVHVHNKFPEVNLKLIGGGDPSKWVQFCKTLGIDESIEFVGYCSTVEKYYSNAGVFVLPSRSEGLSNALLEAQSWGIPCIASDITGNHVIIRDGYNGILFKSEDPKALSEALVEMLGPDFPLTIMGEKAKVNAIENFSIGVICSQIIGIYSTLVKRASNSEVI